MNLLNIDTISTSKKLTPIEMYLLHFINQNPDFFCNHKISEIAQKTNVSPAAITRLAKKLEFSNLKQLQLHVLYKKSLIQEKYKIVDDVDLSSTLQNIKTYHIYSLLETFNTLNLNKASNLINDIKKSQKIMIYGVGSSFVVAKELALNLQKIGIDVICHEDFHCDLLNLPNLKTNDHILLFSKTGETREIQFLIDEGFKRQIPISLITSNVADLKNEAKIKNLISFVTQEPKVRITAIASKIAQFLVADFIFTELYRVADTFTQEKILKGTELINQWNKN